YNDAQTGKVAGDTAEGLAAVAPLAAGGTLARVLGSPSTTGVYAGGRTLYKTGDPVRAAEVAGAAMAGHHYFGKAAGKIVSALRARAAQTAAAEVAPAVVPAVERAVASEAAPVAET